jgi:IS1 family transposase/transposase-like protein
MQCPLCDKEGRRHGKDRKGVQRYFCPECHYTFADPRPARPFGNQYLTMEKATMALRLLMEGMSLRGVCRTLRMGQTTLCQLLLSIGEGCARFMNESIVDVFCTSIQCDELWSFIAMKERTRLRKNAPIDFGDCYTWTAIDRHTKLILAYAVGKRDNQTAIDFVHKLRHATAGRFQIDTDGLTLYRSAIPMAFGFSQDHAQIIKIFGAPSEGEARYSPPQIIDMHVEIGGGNPDLETASTSFVERSNLTIRMMLRRFTRLTNAHSKTWRYHEAAIGLLFAVYNFCRPHMTLNEKGGPRRSPAMAAGLTDHVWSYRELIQAVIPPGQTAIAS